MSRDVKAVRWLVSGRVQGVGFRWFVSRQAVGLRIVGWARNLPDGRVEVLGVGNADNLECFDRSLRAGPSFARVENVEKRDCPHEAETFKSFDIR